MKKKRIILVAVATVGGIVTLAIVSFGLSHTRDSYACKSIGDSEALRVFRFPIWKQRVRVSWSLTGKTCKHDWQWYFANSKGILLNRENWDGPLGNYPFVQEMEQKLAENKRRNSDG